MSQPSFSSRLRAWGLAFLPAPSTASRHEKIRACLVALVGMMLTVVVSRAVMGPSSVVPILAGPMGATALLVFCVPNSPLAQPWPVLAGNILSALVGVACLKWIHDPLVAAPVALCLAIAVMFSARCLHPPGGAVAITAVLSGPAVAQAGFGFALLPVGLNSALLVTLAIVLNTFTHRSYPHSQQAPHPNAHGAADPFPLQRIGFNEDDLDAVFQRYGQVLDVSRDDLEYLIVEIEGQAYRRRFGALTCERVMSRDVVAVEYGTPLQETWMLLRRHNIWAVPVVDPARRVIGIVGRENFMEDVRFDTLRGLASRLRRFIAKPTTLSTDRPEAAGQIMTAPVPTLDKDRPFIDLVPLMTDTGHRHIPIVDAQNRLTGIVSQSDLIAALYGSGLTAALEGA